MSRLNHLRPSWGAIVLTLLIALVYSPALGAGYLGYDDYWLIRDNTALSGLSAETLRTIFFDLSFESRIALGAEYLPVRDLFTLFSKSLPLEAMHALHLFIYLIAALIIRSILIALFGPGLFAELVAILFAVHPVHAESVVWLAGAKDLLALLFTALSVRLYLGDGRSSPGPVGAASFFALLALFSKAMSVIIPGLFLLCDLALRRRVRRAEFGLTLALTIGAFGMHLYTGKIVGMLAPPLAEDLISRAASVAAIFARYLGLSLFVHPHSIVYEVAAYELFDWQALSAIGLFVVLLSLALWAARRGERLHLFAFALFFLTLAPVSQLVAPLQNQMADRYLFIAVLGPLLSFSALYLKLTQRSRRLRTLSVIGLVAIASLLGFERASTYADAEALFTEASIRAPRSPLGPYQLGVLYESETRYREAELAYREAYFRAAPAERDRLRAGNNWARMLYARGALAEALELYETLYREGPPSGRILYNLARVRAVMGDNEGSEAALQELRERFPNYERDRLTLPKSGPLSAL